LEEFEKWKELTLQFVGNRFGGSENIMQAICHMDEGIPHLHIVGTPIYKSKDNIEHLSMRQYLGGKDSTAELQTEYALSVAELGYKRGEERGYSVNSSTATQARALMGQAIAAAPQTPEEYKTLISNMSDKEGMEMLQSLHLKAAMEAELAKDVPRLESLITKKVKENEHLRNELKEKDAELEALKKQNATYQKEHRRRLCELQGAQLSEDKELRDAYFETQDHYIDLGARNFERGGIRMDLDFDGHDDRLQHFIDTDKDGHDDRTETD